MKTVIYHRPPRPFDRLTPCCERLERELPQWGVITRDPAKVTCQGAPRRPSLADTIAALTEDEAKRPEGRTVTCAQCARDFTTESKGGVKYCGDHCRAVAYSERKRLARLKGKAA